MPTEIHPTQVFFKNLRAYKNPAKRVIVNQGGTWSSKTYSVLQLLHWIATTYAGRLVSIVSESLPHLKRGCIRDFQNILGPWFETNTWNKTECTYTYANGSVIEFFGADQSARLRGGRRDDLFINEANNIPKPSFDELQVRTRNTTIIDYNPVEAFWAHEHLIGKPEVEYIHSTYLDAKDKLPQEIVDNIESRKDRDPNWWRVYGLGEVGSLLGLIHPTFEMVEVLPDGGTRVYGLDFGYTNDPTALVNCVIKGDELYSDLLIYSTGLTNDDICDQMEKLGVRKGYDEIIADCAEPKSIEEIHRRGYNVKPSVKGKDSVDHGIQRVNQFKQYWTKRSVDAHKEQRNYRYVEDKNGDLTNKPCDMWDHAMDARRYALVAKVGGKPIQFFFGG